MLENLASEFLTTQNYNVAKEVRVTASELDLLCKHAVNARQIYVECKAHKGNLSSNVLTNLLGTITLKNYAEGWLVTTGPLGKDAKGFLDEWERKQSNEREKLSIYTPERVLNALINAKIICREPQSTANALVEKSGMSLGEWILLISPWGKYWVAPVLESGIPKAITFFDVEKGCAVSDSSLFERFKDTDFELKDLVFFDSEVHRERETIDSSQSETAVVEVEYGEKWFDYRPARPEHFVGRKSAQRTLLKFFTDIKKNRTETRVFAIKGDSGIGKSSLIAKMRDVAKTSQKPNNLFLYAIDMRAANNASYVYTSLLTAFRKAAASGFGCNGKLEVTNYHDPLQSESVAQFLNECVRKHELLILIFDQFEELYSKAELFSLFEEAKRLMFSTISSATNLVLGFAWKTDSTVPQDHPAYHMWHQLCDHRYEIMLRPFSHADAENSLRVFERELSENLLPELKRYLLENSQGYPWLLKKLCIHIYEQIKQEKSQHQLANRSLDISSLFDQDLNNLTDSEMGCLKIVAKNAPMDWYEVLENVGHEVVQSLQNKRLLVRSGNKLNLYWDIFRDYVRTGNVPTIPFNYTPQSPSLNALVRVLTEIDDAEGKSIKKLSKCLNLKENTIRNIIHDLDEFGVITSTENKVTISSHFEEINPRSVLSHIRQLFKRHALTQKLRHRNSLSPANEEQIISYLKEVNPTAQYHIRTWGTYGKRMVVWLQALGLVRRNREGIVFQDEGDISGEDAKKWTGERRRILFLGDTSPSKVIESLDLLKKSQKSQISMKNLGYRNACAVLYRFRLVEITSANEYRVLESVSESSSTELIWNESGKEESIVAAIEYLRCNPSAQPEALGKHIAEEFSRKWKKSSWKRVGNALRQWSQWHMTSAEESQIIPAPPGRKKIVDSHPLLFDCGNTRDG